MIEKEQSILYSGGHQGAERAFAEAAAERGIKVVNFTFVGHKNAQDPNAVVLSEDELRRGDISMELASQMMHRTYYGADRIRKVLQTIFHMVNNGYQVFAVGVIQPDTTVKGGTGWAVELARLFNRPVSVFDQEQGEWFSWHDGTWREDSPRISHHTFVGSGTRNLNDKGRQAIEQLFVASFGRV
ncbi:MAG: hypothetical protein M0017_02720 [Desulfobacteraceae bacterium]|nr:hypothetical protein [Desulfobacteraceae bacterium]